jgi:hypothetical protein
MGVTETMRKLMRFLILTATLLACLGPSAFAQTSGPVNSSQMDAASSQNDQTSSSQNAKNNGGAQNIAAVQKIRQDLESAGLTDVKVVAESFVIQAKSKDGDPMVMTVGPHGMSVFEAMTSGGSNSGTVGSGASAPDAGTNTGASSGQASGAQK